MLNYNDFLNYAVNKSINEIYGTMCEDFIESKKLKDDFKNHLHEKFKIYEKKINELNTFFNSFDQKININVFIYRTLNKKNKFNSRIDLELIEKKIIGSFDYLSCSGYVHISPFENKNHYFELNTVYGDTNKKLSYSIKENSLYDSSKIEDILFKLFVNEMLNEEKNVKLNKNISFFIDNFNKHIWKARKQKRNIVNNENIIDTLKGIDLIKITNEELDLISLKNDINIKEEINDFKNNHKEILNKNKSKIKQ